MSDDRRPSRLETLGAWLGVWTPPRDTVVPPVPWRAVGVGAVLLVLAGAAVAIFVAPAIDEGKQERAASERRAEDERRATRVRRLRAEQRPRSGFLRTRTGAKAEGVAYVERAIGRDARRRFHPRARPASCELVPGSDASRRLLAYDCLSAVRRIVGAGEQKGASGSLGIPYRAVIDFHSASYAFCKTNPVPSEQFLPDPRDVVRLPKACTLGR